MIQLHIRKGLIGEDGLESVSIPMQPGLTPRRLLDRFREHLPVSVAVEVAVDGQQQRDDQLDVPLRDEQEVMLLPVTTGGLDIAGLVVYALISAAVGFAINYVIQLITPQPKPPGEGADRGDDKSPTYAWDGIQTSYGQGFPVPWVYGRHGVGGQVIYTSVSASVVEDRLRLILALSEGPIQAVGDTVATELNALGGLSGAGVPGVSLPTEIRVDGNLLGGPTDSVVLRITTGPGLWPNDPPIVGTTLEVTPGGASVPTIGLLRVVALNNAQATDLDCVLLSGTASVLNWVHRLDATGTRLARRDIVTTANQVRTNGTPGARAWIRPGDLDQSELPPGDFPGTSAVFSPAGQLDDYGAEVVWTYESTEQLSSVRFVLAFPGGLYQLDPQGNPSAYPVRVGYWWREVGSQAWRQFWNVSRFQQARDLGQMANFGALVESFSLDLAPPGSPPARGPIEIRVQRLTPRGGSLVVSSCVWRNISAQTAHVMSYPGVALLGLELVAGARFSGGLPNIVTRIDGIKVRVWDATHGFSPRTWEIPAAPWDFMTSPPGRNPAWILLDFLTSQWGLGRFLKDSDLDLPSFRRWAAFCDRDPSTTSPWGEAAHTCDLVGDSPKPAWEWVLTICATGRASPIYRNGKIGVVYQYRDAHGDLGIAVPAKAPTQLITAGNCERVQVTWLPKANRATAFLFQFLNQDAIYAQDVLPVEDAESTMNDPAAMRKDQYRPETIQAYGTTRPSQVFREGVFRHRVQRLVRRELTFVTGRWALAAEVGDVILFEHELLRPFAADVPLNMAIRTGGTAVTSVVIDHAAAGATQIVVRDPDGKPQTRTITAAVVSGKTTTLTLSAAVTCKAGATCVVGAADKLVQPYEIVSITLQEDLQREVRAIQWVPEIHDEVTPEEFGALGSTDFLGQPEEGEPDYADLRVVPNRDGTHLVTWSRPPSRLGVPVRVYAREDLTGTWQQIGTTEGDQIAYAHFVPGRTYEVAVAAENVAGGPRLPDDGLRLVFVPEEFPPFSPPAVTNVRTVALDDLMQIEWDDLDVRDLAEFEIRIGTCWTSGEPVHRGRAARVLLPNPPGGGTAMIAARSRSGLYGTPVLTTLPAWGPRNREQLLSENDLAPSPAGTHSSTQWNADGWIELVAGALSGTYTSLEQDLTVQAPYYWQVQADRAEIENDTIDDWTFAIDSGEARWRTLNGRPASPCAPGIDWQTTIDDLTMTIDDLPSTLLVQGHVGETGSHTRVLIESRFEFNGVWTAWKKHADRTVVARKMQVRATLTRESDRYEARVTGLTYAAHL